MAKGMIDRLSEVGGGCYGMEMDVEKTTITILNNSLVMPPGSHYSVVK
jgi:hypothetical protein